MQSFRVLGSPSSFRLQTLAGLFVLLVYCGPVHAQATKASTAPAATTTTLDWETLRPEGESFSVLMPKGSTFESGKEPYHKMELSTRIYLSARPAGPVFAVISLSGIKSNPALYTEMQRVNSYVDAFKSLLAPKLRKDASAKLTLVGDKVVQGNPGREYRMSLAELTGTAQVFATRKRFYALVYLNTKKDDSLQEQFLTSFTLPEYFAETTATAQASETAPVSPPETPATKSQPNETADSKPEDGGHVPAPEPGKRKPISGGVLNNKALSLPKPDIPAAAAGIEGVVVVQVTIDEQGTVIEARPVSGPIPLQQLSANAALLARFTPTLLLGEPVKVTGVIVYNFGRPQN
jgi:protein TonB